MTEQMQTKLKNLEGTIEIPEVLENTVETAEEDKKCRYNGSIFNIHFIGSNSIYGNAKLEKIEVKTRYETTRTRISWIPPRVVESEQPINENKTIWSVTSGYNEESRNDQIILLGKIKNKRDETGYRASLVGNAANQGLLLSDELLDKVFSQLEEQLLKRYHKVKDFGVNKQ